MENSNNHLSRKPLDIESIAEIEQCMLGVRTEIAERIRNLEDKRDSLEEDYRAGLLCREDFIFFIEELKCHIDEEFKLLLVLEN